MMNKQHILIICRKAPYGKLIAREALELALATAIFNQQLTMIFTGDGVWQLIKQQRSDAIKTKNHGKLITAFSLYDINDIYVDTTSMQDRGLSKEDLLIDTNIVDKNRLRELMEQADTIFNF